MQNKQKISLKSSHRLLFKHLEQEGCGKRLAGPKSHDCLQALLPPCTCGKGPGTLCD